MQKSTSSFYIFFTILFLNSGELNAQTTQAPLEADNGITAWMLTSTALVLLMVPGLAMFYGGLVRTKNVLGTMMHSFIAMGLMTILWVICGYSMAFGGNVLGGWFGWDSGYILLKSIDASISNGLPDYVFAMFQGKFAIITPALIAGAFAERVLFKSYCLFIILWGLLVYNPLCHWVWASDGYLFNLGAIDFAGGTVVHISAGVSGLVAALYLGARQGYPKQIFRPNNLVMTMIGVGLLWVGWFGFNAGSSLNSGLDTARALTVTQVAAAAGAVTWALIEKYHQGKSTALGVASGILAGLVAITPAAGVVQVGGALFLGGAASVGCYIFLILKQKFGYDDSLDAFGIHGVGGIVGAILLVFFMRKGATENSVATQLGVQATAVGLTILYCVVLTLAILLVIDKLIGFKLNLEDEARGLDDVCHGEQGYGMLSP